MFNLKENRQVRPIILRSPRDRWPGDGEGFAERDGSGSVLRFRHLAILGGMLVVAGVLASPAIAGTASIEQVDGCGDDLACSKYNGFLPVPVITFNDPAGVGNRVRVSRTGDTVTLTDAGTVISVDGKCVALDLHTAQCPVRIGAGTGGGIPIVRLKLGGGNDQVTIDGSLGPDDRRYPVIEAGDGDDSIQGGSGAELFDGGLGSDRIDGGLGQDAIDYSDRTTPVTVDLATGAGGVAGERDVLLGVEQVTGGTAADVLTGSAETDLLSGSGGDDRLDGRAFDDSLHGGLGDDTISGGAGNDTAVGDYEQGDDYYTSTFTPGDDVVRGGAGDDNVIDRGGGRNLLDGGTGDDFIAGAHGPDRILGSGGDDEIEGDRYQNELGGQPDQISGGAGNDVLWGGPAADVLFGGAGEDALIGGQARDRQDGGPDNDRIYSRDRRSERIRCGSGRDVASTDRADRIAACERTTNRRLRAPTPEPGEPI